MEIVKKFAHGVAIGSGIALSVLAISAAYAAYSTLGVSGGDTLSSSKWNEVVQYTVPPGAVMAFNLSGCPNGWSEADGAGGRPNLRGQFIRGLNSSATGLDANRWLATSQNATRVYRDNNTNIGYNGSLYDHDGAISADYDGAVESVTWGSYSAAIPGSAISSWAVYGVRVRPANVALLYCVKN